MRKRFAALILIASLIITCTSCGGVKYDVDPVEMCNCIANDHCAFYGGWHYGQVLHNGHIVFGMVREDEIQNEEMSSTSIVISEDQTVAHDFYFDNEYVYFSLGGYPLDYGAMYRCQLDGSNLELIKKGDIDLKQIVNGRLYYLIDEDYASNKSFLHVCDKNGDNDEKVIDKSVLSPYIIKDKIFYVDCDNYCLHCYDMESKEDQKITENDCDTYFIVGGTLYYTGQDHKDSKTGKRVDNLIKHDLNTGEETILCKDIDYYIKTTGDKIFYEKEGSDGYSIYCMGMDGDEKTLICNDIYSYDFYISNNKLYYYKMKSNHLIDDMYRCDLDGYGEEIVIDFGV